MRAIACIAFVAAALMAPACGGSRVTTDGAPRPLVDAGAPDSARPEDAGEPGGDDAATTASTGAGAVHGRPLRLLDVPKRLLPRRRRLLRPERRDRRSVRLER